MIRDGLRLSPVSALGAMTPLARARGGQTRRAAANAFAAGGVWLLAACGGQATGQPAPPSHPTSNPAVSGQAPVALGAPRTLLADPAALVAGRAESQATPTPSPTTSLAASAARQAAGKGLSQSPVSVMDKKVAPPSGDKHDFQSLSPYWWPDKSKPDGQPYVNRDGETNPEVNDATKYDGVAFGKMSNAVEDLAFGAFLTGQEDYARQAARLLRAWFLDDATSMAPNWRFAQVIPGRPAERGTGIIDGRRLIDVGEEVGMLAATAAWTAKDHQRLQRWYADLAKWLRESSQGRDEARAANNHGTWFDAQLAYLLLFGGDEAGVKDVLTTSTIPRIGSQIEPDGSQPQELRRTLSFHYSSFNLTAFTILARLGERVGVDLWRHTTADGRGIRRALDYVVDRLPGGKPWPEQNIKNVDYFKETGVVLSAAARAYPDGGYGQVLATLAAKAPALNQFKLRLGMWDTG